MMKSILLGAVLVLGMAVFGSAQTAPDVVDTTGSMTRDAATTIHLSGTVEINVDGVQVTAEEADFAPNRSITLHGNVTMTTGTGLQHVQIKTR